MLVAVVTSRLPTTNQYEYALWPAKDWRNELAVIAGIVFEVGILDDHQRCGDSGQPGANCGALALIDRVALDRDARVVSKSSSGGQGSIRRAVVDDHDLLNAWLLQNPAHDQLERALFVEGGNDDPKNWRVGIGAGHGRLV